MGRSRYKFYNIEYPYFMTCTVLHWIPIFNRHDTVEIILNSLRFLLKGEFKLYAFVILENHIDLIVKSPDMSRDIARFKSYTANQILSFLKEKKSEISTMEGVHSEMIKYEVMLKQKIEYIHFNPVKRGFVDLPEHWRYSSARNYSGSEGLIEVCTEL